jgi:hypothetical protein
MLSKPVLEFLRNSPAAIKYAVDVLRLDAVPAPAATGQPPAAIPPQRCSPVFYHPTAAG